MRLGCNCARLSDSARILHADCCTASHRPGAMKSRPGARQPASHPRPICYCVSLTGSAALRCQKVLQRRFHFVVALSAGQLRSSKAGTRRAASGISGRWRRLRHRRNHPGVVLQDVRRSASVLWRGLRRSAMCSPMCITALDQRVALQAIRVEHAVEQHAVRRVLGAQCLVLCAASLLMPELTTTPVCSPDLP